MRNAPLHWVIAIALAACAANPSVRPATTDGGTVAPGTDGGTVAPGTDAGDTITPSSGQRRVVVHAMRTPPLTPPNGLQYIEVELSLINDAGAPTAQIDPTLFAIQDQTGAPNPGVVGPVVWSPSRIECPEGGSIPADSRFRCTVLFRVPADLIPNRVRYLSDPNARTVLAADPATEAERLCHEAQSATNECGDCLASMTSGQCQIETGWVETVCAQRSCSAFGRATDECAAAVGSFHLCVEQICPSCEYVAGVD